MTTNFNEECTGAQIKDPQAAYSQNTEGGHEHGQEQIQKSGINQ